jgi:hypothetical protein
VRPDHCRVEAAGCAAAPGQAAATHQGAVAGLPRPPPPFPDRVGPVELVALGRLVAVRCPPELAHILRRAGAKWQPDSSRWLVRRQRITSVVRALEAATDPLFRQAGASPD